MDSEPPFQDQPKTFTISKLDQETIEKNYGGIVEDVELPVIDVSGLNGGRNERGECVREMGEAAAKWGFFQVVNHGVSPGVLEKVEEEQRKIFRRPFSTKAAAGGSCSYECGCYRWGNPKATCLRQLSWSEAFHFPLKALGHHLHCPTRVLFNHGSPVEEYASMVSKLAGKIAEALAEFIGAEASFFAENCLASSSYLRMNRYPPCPIHCQVYGLVPHTDTDFLTILYQDQLGGLQLVKDGQWIGVKPNPHALIINVGDLFQAWSNDVYKSIKHRVLANEISERFSIAYFMCPCKDTIIQSYKKPPIYRRFTFGDYRKQVQEDVESTGSKIGLPRFLA